MDGREFTTEPSIAEYFKRSCRIYNNNAENIIKESFMTGKS